MTGRWGALRVILTLVETAATICVGVFILSVPLTADIRPFFATFLTMVALFAIFQPGTAGALLLIMSLGFCYLLVTSLGDAFGGALPHPAEVLLIAVALYLIHTIDTLRSSVPANATIDRSLVIRWLRRLSESLVPALILGMVVLIEPTRGMNWIWYFGAIGVLSAVGVPAVLIRRKPWLDKTRFSPP